MKVDLSLSRREKRILVLSAAVAFTAGMWFGVWNVPAQALDVPMTENPEPSGVSRFDLAYRPVPTFLPVVSLVILFGAGWYSRWEPPEESDNQSGEDSSIEAAADGGSSPLPLSEVVTPTLDEWDARLGDGWDTWIAPDQDFRLHIELIDLEVRSGSVFTACEIRLDDCRDGRPYPVVLRETVRNPHLAVAIAELVASEPARYADEWACGLAPRPEDVGRMQDGDPR